jgi:regulator of protease activity HflC (stomatin/prohibitin superfamily)
MRQKLKALTLFIRERFSWGPRFGGRALAATKNSLLRILSGFAAARGTLVLLCILGAIGCLMYTHPPLQTVGRGEFGVRTNRVTGKTGEWRDGGVIVLPWLHELRIFSLRDRNYRPLEIARADGPAPLQSIEGLSLGIDLSVRYALDPTRVLSIHGSLADDIGAQIVEPAVQGVIYKTFARYTVREIFSSKRAEIQQSIEAELKTKLASEGIALRSVLIGKVDLPADYRRGMEGLIAEELATQKMRYTLELKEKRVNETALDGEAEKVHREKAAEAAAREQIIAAKAQEEAMKHVLPFKQRQIEQRQLEAEAEKVARIRGAEGSAQARRIEALGEAEARQKLADAEAYRLERVGKVNAEQMEREGTLVTRHPLLVQKTLVDKLSDKIQVIIAPAPSDGGFIGASLLGVAKHDPERRNDQEEEK